MFYDFSNCAEPSGLLFTKPPSSLTPTTALISGYSLSPSGEWTRLHHSSQALISAASYVSLPLLSRSLLPEWLYRISSLQDAGLIFSYFTTPDGPCPYPLRSSDLIRHLGATFSCPFLSNLAFDHQIRCIRHASLSRSLSQGVPQ